MAYKLAETLRCSPAVSEVKVSSLRNAKTK